MINKDYPYMRLGDRWEDLNKDTLEHVETIINRYAPELGVKHREGNLKILDIGTGSGSLVELFRKNGIQAWGIDVNNIKDGDVSPHRVVGNAMALPFVDNSFDMVVSQGAFDGVFYTTNNYTAIVNEINRVLAPGGCVYVMGSFGVDKLAFKKRFEKVIEPSGNLVCYRKKK